MKKFDFQFLQHRAFQIGIVLKCVDGILELGSGAALMMTSRPTIRHLVQLLTHDELVEDPNDVIANFLVHASRHISTNTQHFAAVYLFVHGVIKIGLSIGLLRGVLWTYPTAVALLSALIAYQLYRISFSHSIILALVTVFDVVIVALIWREWRHARGQRPTPDSSSDHCAD